MIAVHILRCATSNKFMIAIRLIAFILTRCDRRDKPAIAAIRRCRQQDSRSSQEDYHGQRSDAWQQGSKEVKKPKKEKVAKAPVAGFMPQSKSSDPIQKK
jgi:hypothetical protein